MGTIMETIVQFALQIMKLGLNFIILIDTLGDPAPYEVRSPTPRHCPTPLNRDMGLTKGLSILTQGECDIPL